MIRYIALYQGQYPTDDGPREAFAIHDDATIMGWQIVHAVNFRRTGSISFGMSYHDHLLRAKAEESIQGYFRTAIEPCVGSWNLVAYEASCLEPIHTSKHETADDALLAGRKLLAQLIADCTVSELL